MLFHTKDAFEAWRKDTGRGSLWVLLLSHMSLIDPSPTKEVGWQIKLGFEGEVMFYFSFFFEFSQNLFEHFIQTETT